MNLKARMYFLPKVFLQIFFREGPGHALKFLSNYRKIRTEIRNRLSGIMEEYRLKNPGIAYQKYLDLDYWVLECMRRFYRLGLHKESAGKKILDLGTGAGYFPFVCNYYGHRAEALDVPDNEMYNNTIRALGINRYQQYIRAFKDLDIIDRYDLITGFMICFNNHKTPQVWHIKEWDFFLKSIAEKNLNKGGNLFFSFNAESEEEPVSRELLGYFSNHQGVINGCEVLLTSQSIGAN